MIDPQSQVLIDKMLEREPDLGKGDTSLCLDSWIDSMCRKWDAKEGHVLSHNAVGNLLHTLVATRQRTARLVRERDDAAGP